MTRVRAFGADTFRSWRSRNFRLFFVGQIVSQTGTWMQLVAIGLLVLSITDSGVAVGLVTAAQFLPILVLGAWGGVLADRRDRHHLLLATNAIGALVALGFAVVVLADVAELWSIYLLTIAAGTVTALENPARRAFVTDLVEDVDVPNAVGLNSTLMTGSRVVGPAVAGALIAGPGIGWCFAVNALSYVPQLALFARMDRTAFRIEERVAKGKGQLREGIRYVWGERQLRLPLLLVSAVGTFAFNFSVILPLFATRDLGGGATTYTSLFAVMSAGSVVGALAIARRTSADNVFLSQCTIGFGLAMLLLAAAPSTTVACLAVIPVGIGSVMVISGSNAVLQLGTAPAMRGRVLALLAVVFLGSTPVGGPIAGWVSQTYGARWALTLGAAAALLAGGLALRAARALIADRPAPAGSPLNAVVDPSPAIVAPGR